MRTDILEKKEEILKWIEEGQSKAYISAQLKCKQSTLNNYLKKMNIEYAGKQNWRRDKPNTDSYISAEEYLKKVNPSSYTLLYKLIRDNIKEPKCEICGLSQWLDNTIPLELHHKDCNHYNNELNNLQVICPNCHAKIHGNLGISTGLYSDYMREKNRKNSQKSRENHKKICPICNQNYILSSSNMCKNCFSKSQRVVERPSREELKKLIRSTPFTKIGEQFNITDNGVRKWCDAYQLPRKASEIKKYTDEEWEQI